MTPELIEKIKTVATYDGWEYVNDAPDDYPNGYWVSEKWGGNAQLENMSFHYLENLNSLHDVAMMLLADIKEAIKHISAANLQQDKYFLNGRKRCIEYACAFPRSEDGYTALFDACYEATLLLNALKLKQ